MALCNGDKNLPEVGDVVTKIEYDPEWHCVDITFKSGKKMVAHYKPSNKEE